MTDAEQKYMDAYHFHYAAVPDLFQGSLLFEAVCEHDGELLNQIVEAYQQDQHYKASTLLKQLLDDYRADVAVIKTKEEIAKKAKDGNKDE